MKDWTTTTKARARIAELLATDGLEEAAERMSGAGHASVGFASGIWADEATVYVDESWTGAIEKDGERVPTCAYRVQVSWSSTHRSVASALTAVANYEKAIRLAAKIEALVAGFPTVIGE